MATTWHGHARHPPWYHDPLTRTAKESPAPRPPCGFFGSREIQIFGTWKSGILGVQQMKKIKNLKIQIRSAQNVGKVWISRKKILPTLFRAIPGHFLHGPKKSKKCKKKLPIFQLMQSCYKFTSCDMTPHHLEHIAACLQVTFLLGSRALSLIS